MYSMRSGLVSTLLRTRKNGRLPPHLYVAPFRTYTGEDMEKRQSKAPCKSPEDSFHLSVGRTQKKPAESTNVLAFREVRRLLRRREDETLLMGSASQKMNPWILARLILTELNRAHICDVRPQDVMQALHFLRSVVNNVETREGDHLRFSDYLLGIQQALQSKRREAHAYARASVDAEAQALGLPMSEMDVEAAAAGQRLSEEWDQLCTSPVLFDMAMTTMAAGMRRPNQDNLQEACSFFNQSPLQKGLRAYNMLLLLIVRNFRSSRTRQRRRADRLLRTINQEDWRVHHTGSSPRENSSAESPNVPASYDYNQPTTGVGLFNAVWRLMMDSHTPDVESFAILLSMQIKVASWLTMLKLEAEEKHRQGCDWARPFSVSGTMMGKDAIHDTGPVGSSSSRHDGAEVFQLRVISALHIEPWKPVTESLESISGVEGRLSIRHINAILAGVTRYEPRELLEVAALEKQGQSLERYWPPFASVVKLYDVLRRNTTTALESLRQRENGESSHFCADESLVPLLGEKVAMRFPRSITPDSTTYELMMICLVNRALFFEALHVFEDMTGVDLTMTSRRQMERSGAYPADSHNESYDDDRIRFLPTPLTFDALFQGFAKFGIPSRLLRLDANNPSESEWQNDLVEDVNDAQSPWNVGMLSTILEAYLSIKPSRTNVRRVDRRDKGKEADSSFTTDGPLEQESASAVGAIPTYQACVAPGPTPQQLFHLLTALRRTSGDHADWVLKQFERIKQHFGPSLSEADIQPSHRQHRRVNDIDHDFLNSDDDLAEQSPKPNANGWTGWRYNNRVIRVLRRLEEVR